MAIIDAGVKQRATAAVRVLEQMTHVRAAYIFGSHVEGRAHRWSDIDVALFLDGLEKWDIQRRSEAMYQVQKEAGFDVEAHLFSSESLEHPEEGSFASYILNHGVQINLEPA